MKKNKYHLYLTPTEKRMILEVLFDERNLLIAEGKYTDAIDDLILKITKAHRKWLFLSE